MLFFLLHMQDRFAAIAHILPPIDDSQDWYMVDSDQQNGYTTMEVTRQLVTCDKKDVPIKVNNIIIIKSQSLPF